MIYINRKHNLFHRDNVELLSTIVEIGKKPGIIWSQASKAHKMQGLSKKKRAAPLQIKKEVIQCGNKTRKQTAPLFKPYMMNRIALMPPSYDEKIPSDHLVRVVNKAIKDLNMEALINQYAVPTSS